jgi:DNA-binding beta-propeller fold protein YncE
MCKSLKQTVSLGLRRNRPTGLSPEVRSIVLGLLVVVALLLAGNTAFGQSTAAPACAPYAAVYPCVYVANTDGQTVSVISATSRAVIGTMIPLSNSPSGLAVTPDNATVYVALSGFDDTNNIFAGFVGVIDTRTGTNSQPDIPLQPNVNPSQVAISPDGHSVWVAEPSCSDGCSPGVEVIDTANKNKVTTITDSNHPFVDPTSVALSPDGKLAYVTDTCTPNGGGGDLVCLVVVDTSTMKLFSPPPNIPNPINIPNSSTPTDYSASVAVTPDGKLVGVSFTIPAPLNTAVEILPKFAVAFIDPVNGIVTPVSVLVDGVPVDAVPSDFGIAITSTGELYAAAPAATFSEAVPNHVYVFNTNSQSFTATVTVGSGPTGVAVGSDGQTVYVTNADGESGGSVSIIQSGLLLATPTVGVFPQGVAAMPSIPPTITTQPTDQQIPYGGTATLTAQATGTAPLNYQWYQGVSGDTTNPVQGATGSSFTTPALTATTTYWVRVANFVASQNSTTSTVTVLPPVVPTITTQPLVPAIAIGQGATLTVQASGTLPLSYQWFQGTSGDTSTPLQGATGSSFTTPPLNTNTNYWVQVTNIAGSVNSATATVSVSPVPQCALQLQAAGTTGPTISAVATCKDVTNPPLNLATTLDWGDQTPPITISGGSLNATHTYLSSANYVVNLTGVNTLNLEGHKMAYLNLNPLDLSPPLVVFQGQSASFAADVSSLGPVQVNFECEVVITTGGGPRNASDLGISCYAMSQPITLLNNSPTQVTIVIQTTGGAQARLSPGAAPKGILYTCLLPLSGVLVLLVGAWSPSRRRKLHTFLTLTSLSLLLVPIVSCGGGFKAPNIVQTGTPPASYQISVVDMLTSNSPNQGSFVQTTLIVPLQVTPFQ